MPPQRAWETSEEASLKAAHWPAATTEAVESSFAAWLLSLDRAYYDSEAGASLQYQGPAAGAMAAA